MVNTAQLRQKSYTQKGQIEKHINHVKNLPLFL